MSSTNGTSVRPVKCICCKSELPANIPAEHNAFGPHENAALIRTMLELCMQRTLVELPTVQAMCEECFLQLKQSYAFRMKCMQNENDAKSVLSDGNCGEDSYMEHSVLVSMQSDDTMTEVSDLDAKITQHGQIETAGKVLTRNPSFTQCLDIRLIKTKLRMGVRVQQGSRTVTITDGAITTKSIKRRIPFTFDDYSEMNPDSGEPGRPTGNLLDVDLYIMSLVSIYFGSLDERQVPKCVLCNVLLRTIDDMCEHSSSVHYNDVNGMFQCCLTAECQPVESWMDLQNHWYSAHQETIDCYTYLICDICDQPFDSAVRFGKHMCRANQQPAIDSLSKLFCTKCSTQFVSLKRFRFHQQFHLPRSRPKVCVVCEVHCTNEKQFYEHVMFAHEPAPTYFCHYCDRVFATPDQLRAHEVQHKKYACSECDQRFYSSQCLNSHRDKHGQRYFCDYCKCSYQRKFRLVAHMLRYHAPQSPAELPVCPECCQVFANENLAAIHVRRKHGVVETGEMLLHNCIDHVFVCEYCESNFETLVALADHKATHTEDLLKFECVHCPSKYDQYGKLRTHYNKHAEMKSSFPVKRLFVCEHCPKQFVGWRSYQSHRKNIHTSAVPVIECDLCKRGFHKITDFEHHRKMVHGVLNKCPSCERRFVARCDLRKHIQRVHTELRADRTAIKFAVIRCANSDGTVSCRLCGHVAKSDQMLRIHVSQLHSNTAKSFECFICHKTCTRKQSLMEHMATHDTVKPYECPICQHRVCSQTQLNYHHKQKHSTERPFACDQCAKTFTQSKTLRVHKALHSGIRHTCPVCDASFSSRNNVYIHLKRKHNGNRPATTKSKKGKTPAKYEYIIQI